MNRQMGGSRLRNGLGNGSSSCNLDNGLIESDAELAELARHLGVKLGTGENPDTTPIWSPWFGQWVIITDIDLQLTGLTDPKVRPDRLEVL